jgi:hypothetical protein
MSINSEQKHAKGNNKRKGSVGTEIGNKVLSGL